MCFQVKKMKAYWLLMLLVSAAFILTACHNEDPDSTDSIEIVGSWYEEDTNEEVVYYENGLFYDTYCTIESSAYTEGHYYMKGNSLSETFSFLGDSHTFNFEITNYSDYSFTISSEMNGSHKYHKIVETIDVPIGGQVSCSRLTDANSIKLLDERLVSINGQTISSLKRKGTTYIKLTTSNGDCYIKVRCGVEEHFYDYWYDYTHLFGASEREMKDKLGQDPLMRDNVAVYSNMNGVSPFVSSVLLFIENNAINEIHVNLRDDISETDVIHYLGEKYFPGSLSGDTYFYQDRTNTEGEDGYVVVAYERNEKKIVYFERKDYWPNMEIFLGKTKEYVKANNKDNLINDEDYGYIEYEVRNKDVNIDLIDYFFNGVGGECDYIGIRFVESVSSETVFTGLDNNYVLVQSGLQEKSTYFIYRNMEMTVELCYYPDSKLLIYSDLTLETLMWPDYSKAMGLSHAKILSTYCPKPYENTAESIIYLPYNPFASLVMFFFDSNTDAVNYIGVSLTDTAEESMVVENLNSIYTIFEKGTQKDQSQYAWINASNLQEATVGIIYNSEKKIVSYQTISSSSAKKNFPMVKSYFFPTPPIERHNKIPLRPRNIWFR